MDEKLTLFEEIDRHLVVDAKPEQYLNSLDDSLFTSEYPFTMLNRLKKVKQSPQHHPEGNVWNHTMLVVGQASKRKEKSSDARAFMWAALLHDVGKAETTRSGKGKITAYDHDKAGAKLTEEFLKCFTDNQVFIDKVIALVRWHMQILYVVNSLPYADIKSMKQQTNTHDIALLGLCDRLGRAGADRKREEANIQAFLKQVSRFE